MRINEGLCVQEVPNCLLCDIEGNTLYKDLRDRLFSAPGTWVLMRCPQCGLVWLNPRLTLEDIGKVYTAYHTHILHPESLAKIPKSIKNAILASTFGYDEREQNAGWKWVGQLMSLVPIFKDMVGLSIMGLKASECGKIVDIGCGNGQFLAQMRDLGWHVLGIESDVEAASIAQDSLNIPVIAGTLESASLPESSYDVVTMNHVIEHVHDPIRLFKEINRILKPNGKLVVLTPNVESLGHRMFRSTWRGLETPRHLYLFNGSALQLCAEQAGLLVETLRTTARAARFSWADSKVIRLGDKTGEASGNLNRRLLLESYVFQALEEVIRFFWKGVGEELLMIARGKE